MGELDDKLRDLSRGQIGLAEVTATIDDLTARDAAAASKAMLSITDARDAGLLDADQYRALLTQIISSEKMNVTAAVNLDDPVTQVFAADGADDRTTVGAGSIIKDRFVLEGMLGSGGMGVVYKALDRVRIEAKDRNPHVAVKVLNEDFKVHPEAFIALQRECSKAQRLAHPNIATVYDFDRTGGMAFMTMEMLSGKPLNEYFATELPDDGLPFAEAWPIIRGMAQALGYAHKNRIVHSDFKPGNCFLCDDGEVKVLDFGIARAVKAPGQAETTTFDAGSLGALTPTYASPEMLEGDPPDPRDDIYALGVVSYILLASQHPYERYPGNMAKALDLKPKPIAKLDRAQNAALASALAFEREKRCPDVATFLHGLQGGQNDSAKLERQSRLVALLAAGLAIMMGCVLYLLLR